MQLSCSARLCVGADAHVRRAAQVLQPLMLPEELEEVNAKVAQLYSRSLADAFRRLQPQVCSADLVSAVH